MEVARRERVLVALQHMVQLVGIGLAHMAQRDPRELGRCPRRASSERQPVDQQDVDEEQRQRRRDLGADHAILVLELEQRRGDEVEVGAMGVISVPQKPASMPIAPTTAGSPP